VLSGLDVTQQSLFYYTVLLASKTTAYDILVYLNW